MESTKMKHRLKVRDRHKIMAFELKCLVIPLKKGIQEYTDGFPIKPGMT